MFCILSFSCPCLGVFPGNKGCVRIYDEAEKGNSTTVTVTAAPRVQNSECVSIKKCFLGGGFAFCFLFFHRH